MTDRSPLRYPPSSKRRHQPRGFVGLVGDHDVEQTQSMPPAIESDDSDQSPSFITVELDSIQGACQLDRLRSNRKSSVGEHTLESPELLAIAIRVDKHILG
jgi:hypothetical protein